MEFVELTEKEFKSFEISHVYGSFYQTINWGKLKEKNGWKYYLLGIKENKNVVAATLLLKKKVFKNISIMYAPRGYLIDYNNFNLLKFFTYNIKKFGRKNNAIFIKIDPYVIYKERDINGDIVKKGINNSNVVERLINLGYKRYDTNQIKLQPQYAFALNFNNRSIDEIFDNFEPTTRKMIRKNEKMGIYCREIGVKELNKFTDVMNSTSARREFIDRPFEYYKNMVNIFKDDLKIVIAEINLKNYIKNLKLEIKTNKEEIKKKENEIKNKGNINVEKTNNIIKEYNNVIDSLNKRLERGIELQKSKGDIVVLGGIMFLLHNKEMLSLFGGAYGEYKDFMVAYSTNWYMIQYAVKNGYNKYNFYGISNFKDKEDKMYGLYDFKRGFGGNVEEYIGEYDLVVSKIWYFIYNVLYTNIYLKIKKFKLKKNSNYEVNPILDTL